MTIKKIVNGALMDVLRTNSSASQHNKIYLIVIEFEKIVMSNYYIYFSFRYSDNFKTYCILGFHVMP